MSSLTAAQLAALREVLGAGGRAPAEVQRLIDELDRQQQDAVPVAGHGLAEARSLEIHRLVAARLREDPTLVGRAVDKLRPGVPRAP